MERIAWSPESYLSFNCLSVLGSILSGSPNPHRKEQNRKHRPAGGAAMAYHLFFCRPILERTRSGDAGIGASQLSHDRCVSKIASGSKSGQSVYRT
jgi:hypothetical protein